MDYEQLADALAFCGNSLLSPMTQTANIGLDSSFWDAFPTFGSNSVAAAAEECAAWSRRFVAQHGSIDNAVANCAIEFTHLFIGPPRPAAAPWETMYQDAENGAESSVGFGEPTFEMRAILREHGMEISNKCHQYEDHMGIELLLLSELCRRTAQGDSKNIRSLSLFATEHPSSWIDPFLAKVEEEAPDGYFARLLNLTAALLEIVE